jgi:hypothetical protein
VVLLLRLLEPEHEQTRTVSVPFGLCLRDAARLRRPWRWLRRPVVKDSPLGHHCIKGSLVGNGLLLVVQPFILVC